MPPSVKLRSKENLIVRQSEMCEAEARTLVEMMSKPGETVYDGSAGTCVIVTACLRLGRKVVVADPDQETLQLGIQRCKRYANYFAQNGLLPIGEVLPKPPQEVCDVFHISCCHSSLFAVRAALPVCWCHASGAPRAWVHLPVPHTPRFIFCVVVGIYDSDPQ